MDKKIKSDWLKWILILCQILFFISLARVAFPIFSPKDIYKIMPTYQKLGLLRWEDGKDHNMPQDFADMLGWKEMALLVDSAIQKLDKNEQTIILCDNYGQAGAINFYSKGKIKAATFNADYINWMELDKEIVNVILVQQANDTDKERKKERDLFNQIVKIGEIKSEFAREKGTAVYALIHAKKDINTILKEEKLNLSREAH